MPKPKKKQEEGIKFKQKSSTKAQLDKILHPVVKDWFYSRFPEYSLPQLYAVMEIHSRTNVLVSAPTGATKTLTGFLSILNELVDASFKGILEDKIYSIYISPLKALNEDIKVNLIEPLEQIKKISKEKYNKEIDIRVAVRSGDTTANEKAKMLRKPPHIFITTPETLGIVMSTTKFIEKLKSVQWCIIDEIHSLAEGKRGTHLALSIERLEEMTGYMTRIGLSATVSPLEEIAKYLVGNNRSCKIIDVQFIKSLDLKVLSPADNLIDISYNQLHSKMYKLIDDLVQKHKTTLIFTNTRAATERVVHHLKEKFPRNYTENIGAHHGSLSKEHRHDIEQRLRDGKLKVVVSSTSLELGIDIGNIDLVLCLGSPKTVARALQRIGRSGHRLHQTTKGRFIVMDRDDLVECSVLLKNAMEKKIDRIHIPDNALDVLSQQILGAAIQKVWKEDNLFNLITSTYPYKNLKRKDFDAILSYLAGEYTSLEDRNVYAKIWRKEGNIGKRGKMIRLIYMTNIGTIPSQGGVKVKLGNHIIGSLDESFLERLRKRDVFVLGGSTYEFRYARGMTAVVNSSLGKPPTVPSWVSEMLPLSFDLASNIQVFRRLMEDKFASKKSKKDIISFINKYLYVDKNAAEAIYIYMKEQYDYSLIPHDKRFLIELYNDDRGKKIIFHSLFGRRVNDCLSRAVAYIISKYENVDVEIGISDNGFYIGTQKSISVDEVMKVLVSSDLREIMMLALEKTEVLKRRFRHCAERSLMILRNYMGRSKRAGRQQSISSILINSVKAISNDFPILKEARREVLEDLMDISNAEKVVDAIRSNTLKIEKINTTIPSPFAFQLVLQGYTDVLKIDDKLDFLKRMHNLVLAKISLDKGKKKQNFDFELPKIEDKPDILSEFKDYISKIKKKGNKQQKKLATQLYELEDKIPVSTKIEIAKMIEGRKHDKVILSKARKYERFILRKWPRDLAKFIIDKAKSEFSYEEEWKSQEAQNQSDNSNNFGPQSGNETGNETKPSDDKRTFDNKDNIKSELYKKMIYEQFIKVHKELNLEPEIYFELERLIEDPDAIVDKKFKKWAKELTTPPTPKQWPKELIEYIRNSIT